MVNQSSLKRAQIKAKSSFKTAWYHLALDFQRIVPVIDFLTVKVQLEEEGREEYLWLDELFFDGEFIEGKLINIPNALLTFQQGERYKVSFDKIWDWLCSMNESLYGGYTILALRRGMTKIQQQEHDIAWGLSFEEVFCSLPFPIPEIEQNLVLKIQKHIQQNENILKNKDVFGRTVLHREVLFGRYETTRLLINLGANVSETCNKGWTPLNYAQKIGWDNLITLFN